MTRASKLYPSKIQAQCNEAIKLLEENNNCLQNIQSCISEFVNDTMIESIAFDQLKMQCENYIGVIDSITNINNSDISDYGKLSSEVGSEVLEGEIIITNQEKFMRLRDEAYENEHEYRSKASNCWYAPLAVIYSAMAEMFRFMGDNYQEEYQVWVEKEMLYDSIEAATSGLFANSGAVRGTLGSLLSELQGSFKLYFGYTPDTVALENMQLKYIEQGDIDTANGIKALNEYLIQTGKFTAAERNAIINNISECAPEKLRSLPHITSAAGTAAGIANMEELIASCLRNKGRGFSDEEIMLDIKDGLYSLEDYEYLVAIGKENPTYEGFYAVACCVRNRIKINGGSYKDIVTAKGQFMGYREENIGKPENDDIKIAAIEVLRGGESIVGESMYFFGIHLGYDLWCDPTKCNEFYNVEGNVFYDTYGSVHNKLDNKTEDAVIIYDSKTNTWNYESGSSWKK